MIPCTQCVFLKHLPRAIALIHEHSDLYPDRIPMALGELSLAEDEADPDTRIEIRDLRLDMTGSYAAGHVESVKLHVSRISDLIIKGLSQTN